MLSAVPYEQLVPVPKIRHGKALTKFKEAETQNLLSPTQTAAEVVTVQVDETASTLR